jgi:hypothetical protein
MRAGGDMAEPVEGRSSVQACALDSGVEDPLGKVAAKRAALGAGEHEVG